MRSVRKLTLLFLSIDEALSALKNIYIEPVSSYFDEKNIFL